MTTFIKISLFVLLLFAAAFSSVPQMLHYSGRLLDSGGDPIVDGTYTVIFTIYDDSTSGSAVWTESQNIFTEDGLFTVLLGSGAPISDTVFYSPERYLGIKVGSDPELTPRTRIVSSAYALTAGSILDPEFQGAIIINATNATEVGNGIVFLDLEADTVFTLTYKNDVGGVIDFYDPVDTKDGLALGALKLKISRQGTVYFGASISDTVLNLSSTGTILTNNTAVNGVNSIGLGVNNINDADTSSVLGGYENVIDSLSRLSSIVSGDYNSLKGSDASSILSGKFNTISSGSDISSVSGGGNNRISAEGAFIGGGGGIFPIDSNSTTGNYSAILGGRRNYVTGTFGVVAGGYRNEADSSSFAAGELAKATHTNAFVWSDGSASTSSSGTHTFTTKATGGYNLYSDANGTAGVSLSSGSGTWASISDSTLKRNIREVNYYEVLDKLSELKISQWSYLAQDADIEHIGPMAQDFYRLFGLGDDNKHISTLDPDGVALAAIKALHEKNNELSDQNEKLEREIQEVKTLLQELIDSK